MNKILTAIGLSLAISGNAFADEGALVPNIDNESYELGLYAGTMRIVTDSDNTIVYGARLSYHINDFLFLEGSLAAMNLEVSHELEGNPTDSQAVGSYYYNGAVGFNFIPGELFFSKDYVVPVYFYTTVGAGNTVIDDTNTFALNVGGGIRFLMTESIALRFDIKDHIFDASEALGSDDQFTMNNFEVSFGASWFF